MEGYTECKLPEGYIRIDGGLFKLGKDGYYHSVYVYAGFPPLNELWATTHEYPLEWQNFTGEIDE